MRLVLSIILIAVAHGTRETFATMQGGTALALGLLLIVGYFVGDTFERFKLPRLTGYIITGLALGPYGLSVIGRELGDLKLVNGTAVAVIAMTAGSELEIKRLRPLLKSTVFMVTAGVLLAAVLISATAFASHYFLGFVSQLSTTQAIAVSATLGVVLAAQSPAVVVALRRETGACGPLPDTVLGAVIVGDLLVIFLFAIAEGVAKPILGSAGSIGEAALHLLWHILGSLVIGGMVGMALAAWLRRRANGATVLVIISCFVLAEIGQRLDLDPIIVAVIAGAFVRNRAPAAAPVLDHGLEATSSTVYVLFFAVTGASLHLDALAVVGIPAVMIVLARALGLFVGARGGAKLAGADPLVQRFGGIGLLPQAGLALALALVFAKAFPDIGSEASALALSVVALNELAAPAVWRAVMSRHCVVRPDDSAEAAVAP
jgi:Kef-type K+ transport system membrane component KefB